ncbi:MAG: ATP-binding protein [Calditrichaceae bacterium]
MSKHESGCKNKYNLIIYIDEAAHKRLGSLFNKIKRLQPALLICLISGTAQPKAEHFNLYLNINDYENKSSLENCIKIILELITREMNYSNLSSLILHDLRSPAQSIGGYVDLLADGVFGELNAGQLKIIRNTSALVDKLVDLLDDLQKIYLFEINKIEIMRKKFQVKDLIEQALRSIWIQTDKKNIKLVPHIEPNLPVLNADPDAIQRVIINLLSNAIKYCPDNGTIRMEVQKIETSAKSGILNFRITDTGPGINSDEIPFIFDRYYQSSENSGKSRGFGLGLYISKLIIEAHDGQIGVYNNREGGATFYINLPVKTHKITA